MQPALSTPSTQSHVLALRLRSEKPHQGVRSKNPAPYRGHNRCKLRTALGLRTGLHGNRVRPRCSGEQYDSDLGLYYLRARYYNPNTGRFMSRDPLDGQAFDPKTLHKYLYAGGDPVNAMDPTGREMFETALEDTWIERASEIALRTYIVVACAAYTYEALKILGLMEEFPAFLGGAGGGFVCGLLAGGYPALHASHCEIQLLARPHWQPHRVHRAE